MKLSSALNSWNVPGTKCCVHRNGMTAVVSETDSIYIYSGGKEKPLHTLNFNPKSGQAVLIGPYGEENHFSIRQLLQCEEAKRVFEKGMQLLSAARYSPPRSEEEKIYRWTKSLCERQPIDREELKNSRPHLIARIETSDGHISCWCGMLGSYMYPIKYIGEFIKVSYVFYVEKDPDLAYGIRMDEQDNHEMKLKSPAYPRKTPTCEIGPLPFCRNVPLTREEAKWLRELLPPYQTQRFLSVHAAMTEADEAKKMEREREMMREISRAGGKTDPFGTVAI